MLIELMHLSQPTDQNNLQNILVEFLRVTELQIIEINSLTDKFLAAPNALNNEQLI
jgi:hypothetical protein